LAAIVTGEERYLRSNDAREELRRRERI
jgi:hypothetical protein